MNIKNYFVTESVEIDEEIVEFVKNFIKNVLTSNPEDFENSRKLEQLGFSILNYILSLEDLTYAEKILEYLMNEKLMPEITLHMSSEINRRKNLAKGMDPSAFNTDTASNLKNTSQLLHNNMNNPKNYPHNSQPSHPQDRKNQ